MKKKTLVILLFSMGFSLMLFSQVPVKPGNWKNEDTVLINNLLKQSNESLRESPEKAISLAQQAKELSVKIGFLEGLAYANKNIGLVYYFQGKLIETLDYWNQSLGGFESINDQIGVANLLNNISAVYTDQGAIEKGLGYALKSLEISEKTGDKLRILSALNSVGSIYFNKSEGAIDDNKTANREKALQYLLRALPLCEELGDNDALGVISENIGEIYFEKGNDKEALTYFNKSLKALGNTANSSFALNGIGKLYLKEGDIRQALIYHNKALAIAEKFSHKLHMVRSLQGIGNVYINQKNYTSALNYFSKASTIAEEIKAVPSQKDLYQEMAIAYSKNGDFKKAFKYQSLFSNIKDTLYNIETDKKLGSIQFDFDMQKKQGEINLLTKDMDLADLKLKRQKFAKNAFMVGLVLVFMIALLIYRNYRIKVRTHKILDQQKNEIEGLLLNILPVAVAKELQTNGHAISRNYESVSVLFTDFKGFTAIADKMSPQDLVEELNICFMAFDEIIEKYQLEKIKTIGDSYMCAGGIPTTNTHHVDDMIKASIEIRDFTKNYNQKRKEAGLESWELRIGIHVGPVVAGVVGKKKYAYDIWGSTVNIASRMESNGMPGQINISSSIYQLIKDKYTCIHRGKIHAKNIGEIDMYFIEAENGVNGKENLIDQLEMDAKLS